MVTKRHMSLLFLCLIAILALTAVQVVAQADEEEPAVCPAIVEQAFEQAGEVCAGYGVGQVCIGSDVVNATFAEEVDEDFFTQPGDIADLSLIQSITTEPVDTSNETWGLAVINSQVNLPTEVVESLDGKGAIYFVLGGIEVTEATPEENILVPLQAGIPITTIAAADMRVAPVAIDDEFSNVISQIPAESTVNADAISADEEWVRVVFEDQAGWISSSVLPSSEDLSALVEIGPDTFTPMQSFNMALNGDNGDCVVTEQGVVIHGPDSLPIDVQVDGIPIRVDSTIFVTPLPGNRLRVFTFTGVAVIYPNDPARRTLVPPGFFADIDLSTGNFVTPNPFPGTNIAPFGGPFTVRFLNFISRFYPTNLTHYSPNELGITAPSGVGDTEWLIIHINVQRLDITRALCSAGILAENVCAVYDF